MKILLILEATLGGTSRHILDLATGLLSRGHTVHLAYSTLRADNKFLAGIVELTRHPSFHGLSVPMQRELGLSDISSFRTLRSHINRHGPFDVVHTHSTKAGFLGRLATPLSTTSIYTPHALMTQDPSLRGIRRAAVCALESALALRTGTVIAVSDSERLCAINTGIREAKLTVVPNGLNRILTPHDRSEARWRLGLAPGTFCVGTVGLLVPNKEHSRLLDAFGLFRQRHTGPAQLVVIGWGPMESHLRSQADRIGLGDSIQFLGQVPANKYIPGFDVLAHPSRYEGFGYVFLEAFQSGVPVVSANVGGAKELILPGVTGFLCDPWDTQQFAAHLLALASDPRLLASMRVAAPRHAELFSADRMVESTLEVYHRALQHRGAARLVATTSS